MPDYVACEHSAVLFTVVIGETAIFLPFQKHHLVAENESVSPSAVFVQTNAKIHPCFYAASCRPASVILNVKEANVPSENLNKTIRQ